MEKTLKELYKRETAQRLDFDQDPDYQKYYAQVLTLLGENDLPFPLFHLLETSNYLSFAHAFRLGLKTGLSLNT